LLTNSTKRHSLLSHSAVSWVVFSGLLTQTGIIIIKTYRVHAHLYTTVYCPNSVSLTYLFDRSETD